MYTGALPYFSRVCYHPHHNERDTRKTQNSSRACIGFRLEAFHFTSTDSYFLNFASFFCTHHQPAVPYNVLLVINYNGLSFLVYRVITASALHGRIHSQVLQLGTRRSIYDGQLNCYSYIQTRPT